MFVCVFVPQFSGGSDEVHGQPHQADERDPERDKDPEVLRLGKGLSRACDWLQRARAQGFEEISDPVLHLLRLIQRLLLPGIVCGESMAPARTESILSSSM